MLFLEAMVLKRADMKTVGPFEFLTSGAIFCASLYWAFLLYREPASRYFDSRAH